MMARKIRRGIHILAPGLAAVWAAGPALSQDQYYAPAQNARTPWEAIVCTAIFLAGIAIVGFKHARRTHLD